MSRFGCRWVLSDRVLALWKRNFCSWCAIGNRDLDVCFPILYGDHAVSQSNMTVTKIDYYSLLRGFPWHRLRYIIARLPGCVLQVWLEGTLQPVRSRVRLSRLSEIACNAGVGDHRMIRTMTPARALTTTRKDSSQGWQRVMKLAGTCRSRR